MGYKRMGSPDAKVSEYPDGQHNMFGGRKKITVQHYKLGLSIIKDLKYKADYWKDRVPFFSAQLALEAANVADKVRDKYAEKKPEEQHLDRWKYQLEAVALEQMEKALIVPTSEILAFARSNGRRLYNGNVATINDKILEYANLEKRMKGSEWGGLLSMLNTACMEMHFYMHTLQSSAATVRFTEYFHTDSRYNSVATQEQVHGWNLRRGADKLSEELAKFMANKLGAVWDVLLKSEGGRYHAMNQAERAFVISLVKCETREAFEEKANEAGLTDTVRKEIMRIKEGQGDAFSRLGEMISVLASEFGMYYQGVKSAIILEADTHSILQAAGGILAKLVDEYVSKPEAQTPQA